MNKDINNVMMNVRTAYRLLHDYQRMVLDAVKYIGNQLGLSYYSGAPKFSNSSSPKSSLDCWAWDWLNMICYEFHFYNNEKMKLSIMLLSDTGYFEANLVRDQKVYTEKYISVAKSHSKIVLVASCTGWGRLDMTPENVLNLIGEKAKLPQPLEEAGMFACCYDIAKLCSIDSVNAMLDDFISRAKDGGISFQRLSAKDESNE